MRRFERLHSVAIKGSTFSKSTGDAGGDKKGVASGTIGAEAKFICKRPMNPRGDVVNI